MAAEGEDFSGLPLNEKLAHKNWKARLLGYEELTKKFKKLEEDSPEYTKLSYDIKKYVVDANPAAMEKALETTIAFFETAPTSVAQKIVPELIVGIIAKCLIGRTTTKKFSILVCLFCIEVDQHDCVMEELIKGWTNKLAKIATAAINATTCCITEFGVKIFNIKSILKALPGPFVSTDKNVRTEIKTLTIELCKWLKVDPVNAALKDLKPVILKELEEEWTKIDSTPPNPTRLLRSQQNIQAEPIDDDNEDDNNDGAKMPSENAEPLFDPLDLIDPVDLLKKFPDNFFTDIVSVKWKERSDALNAAVQIAEENTKIIPADYSELMKILLKIIVKDTNINCSMASAKLVTFIAKGLKKNFEPFSKELLSAGFDKLKDKKPQVVTTLRDFCDAIYQTTTLNDIKEVIMASFENKSPSAKAELCLFLARSFCYCTPAILTKPILKDLVTNLVKKLEDTSPEVRTGASQALATCIKVVGQRNIGTYLEDVEKNKLAKIEEAVAEIVLKVPQGTTATQAPKAAKKTSKQTKDKENPATTPPPPKQTDQKQAKSTTSTTAKKEKQITTTAKSANSQGNRPKATETAKKNQGKDDVIRMDNEPNVSTDELETMSLELFGESVISQIKDAKWKDRVEGCEKIKTQLEEANPSEVCAQVYLHALLNKPGLADGNIQALNAKFGVIVLLIPKCSSWGEKSCENTIIPLCEKLGEPKLKANASESLFRISERIGSLTYVSNIVLETAMKNKNPKVQSEGLLWLCSALDEFGLVVQPKPFIEYMKTAIGGTNPVVKNAGITLLTCFAKFFGAKADILRNLLGDINPALEPKINGAISGGKESEIPTPSRSLKPQGGAAGGGEETSDTGKDLPGPTLPLDDDLIERVDISGKLASVISALNHPKWEERNEALKELGKILNENPYITPNLGELPSCLKARMDEKNRNITMYAFNQMATLAENLGPGCNKHAKLFISCGYTVLGDQKPQLKKAAIDMLDAWHKQIKLYSCLENDLAMVALKIPSARADFYEWLNSKLKEGVQGKLPKTELLNLIPAIGDSLEDKAGVVREKSKLVLLTIVELIGKDSILKTAAKCKSNQAISAIVKKSPSDLGPTPASQPPTSTSPTNLKKLDTGPGNGSSNKISSGQKQQQSGAKVAPVPEPPAPPFKMGQTRDQREAEEKKFGSTKCPRWDFDKQAGPAHIKYLQDHMSLCIQQELIDKLMHRDPLEQSKAIRTITKDHLKNFEEEIINCYDLILKWITFRLVDTNTTLLLDCIVFLKATIPILSERNYKLSESEANCFLPYLVQKLGNPKDAIRKDLRFIIHNLCQIYPPHKLYSFLSAGLTSRNSKLKIDCIEYLGEIINEHGTGVCSPTPQKAIEALARCMSENDQKTKSAALACMVNVYNCIGDQLFKYVGVLAPRDKDLLNDRIEKSNAKTFKTSLPNSPQPPTFAEHPRPPSNLEKSRENGLANTDNNTCNTDLPRSNQSSSEDIQKDIVNEEQAMTNNQTTCLPSFVSEIDQQQMKQPSDYEQKIPDGHANITHSIVVEPSTPRYSGPFKIQPDLAYQQYKLQEITPTSKLKRPSPQLDSVLHRPTITTSYQTSRLHDRTQYANEIPNIIKFMVSENLCKVTQESRKMEQILKMQPHKLVDHLPSLIRAITCKVSTFSIIISNNAESDDLFAAIRAVMSCLLLVCTHRVLAKRIQYDCLKDLFAELAKLMLRASSAKQEGADFVTSMNMIIAKILENCEQNMLFKVLLTLMLKCLMPNDDGKFTIDIYMKCLWRMTRIFSTNIKLLRVSELLQDIDEFFIGYLKLGLVPTVDDQPHKTVKTIVFYIATELGQDVWNYTDLLPSIESSYTCAYLRRALSKQHAKAHDSVNINTSSLDKTKYLSPPSKLDTSVNMTPAARFRAQLTRCMDLTENTANAEKPEVNQQLAQIFTRIGSRDASKQGLADLYKFMQTCHNADLSPFLMNTSNIFQNYIERGLQSIESDMRVQDVNANPRTNTHNNISEISNSYALLRDNARDIMGISLDKLELRSPQSLNNTSYHSKQQQQYINSNNNNNSSNNDNIHNINNNNDNNNNKKNEFSLYQADYGQESNVTNNNRPHASIPDTISTVSNHPPATSQQRTQGLKDTKLEELKLKYASICNKQKRN